MLLVHVHPFLPKTCYFSVLLFVLQNELELLMMSDSEENKKHFSIKDMESEHKKESAKKKRKKRKLKADNDVHFQYLLCMFYECYNDFSIGRQ